MELGDADDPMNSWRFGESAELFSYSLVGMHPTMSGFTAILPRAALEALAKSSEVAQPGWDALCGVLRQGSPGGRVPLLPPGSPFLFAGTVLDAPSAAVYVLKRSGAVTGMLISSEAAE